MKKQTSTDLRRALREQRAAYEELLGLSGAILAALCVRCGDGATLRLPKQAVHDALETYEFAAAATARTTCSRTGSARHDRPRGREGAHPRAAGGHGG